MAERHGKGVEEARWTEKHREAVELDKSSSQSIKYKV